MSEVPLRHDGDQSEHRQNTLEGRTSLVVSYTEQARALDTVDYTERSAFYRILGTRIRMAREAKGWEQKALAEHLKVSQSAMSRIESGETEVSVFHLMEISTLLDMGIKLTFSNKLYKVFKT